jgi:redox-sensitive bicupin YhaK (pirin superfamily)
MPGSGAVIELIVPRSRDLGGFSVRRILPAAGRQMIGPFIFLDHMGPTDFPVGAGVDVRPHPHIGLATVTWLFEGALFHRDSLGMAQEIVPGEVNWMTAGSGIVHSERTPPAARQRPSRLHGMQSWIALPRSAEEVPPAFQHLAAAALPRFTSDGIDYTVIAGTAFGLTSPVTTFSPMGYAAVTLASGQSLVLPPEHAERAVYVAEGELSLADLQVPAGTLAVLDARTSVTARGLAACRFMLLGGEPIDGPRQLWWNFVASDAARIERAKADWQAGRFPAVPGETEFIPLPEK